MNANTDILRGELERLFELEELKAGIEIAGHKVIKKVGEGALGVVYLAERKNPEGGGIQRAALKIVHAELSRNRASVRRYLTVQRAFMRSPIKGMATILAT